MGLPRAVFDAALKRPWLLAPPLAGLAARRLLSAASSSSPFIILNTLLGVLVTAAVTAVFCELWLGDGRRLEAERVYAACLLFLLPYPLLLLVGMVSAPAVYGLLRSGLDAGWVMPLILLQAGLGKLIAFAFGALSALAVARRAPGTGVFVALGLGYRALRMNAGFLAPALIATLLIQETAVYFLASTPLVDFLAAAIPLLGCVAVPLEAWRSGRLTRP